MIRSRVVPGLAVAAVFLAAAAAPAQTQLQPIEAEAQLRDAAFDSAGGMYVAVYDRGEVWKLSPGSAQPVATVHSGRGPVALAVSSDGVFLACANNLSSDVAVFSLPAMQERTTVECPKGPTDIAAMPDGRFAVASPFAGAVVVVDPNDGSVENLDAAPSVPSSLAVAGDLLVVAGRVPAALHLYSTRDLQPVKTIALDAAPAALAAVGSDQVAVAAGDAIMLVDAATGATVKRTGLKTRNLAAAGDLVYCLKAGAVAVMNVRLEQQSELKAEHAVALAADGGTLVALAPKSGRYYCMASATEAAAAPVTEATPLEPAETVELAAAETPPEPEPAPPPEPPAPPAVEPTEAQSQKPAAVPAPPAVEPTEAQQKKPSPAFRQMPLVAPDVRAPKPRMRPTPAPTIGLRHPSLEDMLSQRIEFNPDEAFQEPDWTQPLRDVRADILESGFEGSEMSWRGNVRLRLDTLKFKADKFVYRGTTGEYHATGDVLVTQGESMLAADDIYYRVPTEEEMPHGLILEPHMTEQQRARRRLSSGTVIAKMMEMVQPNEQLAADEVQYNFAERTGEITNAHGRVGIYYFGGKKLRILGPATIDGEEVWVTTCNLDPPHYRIKMNAASIRDGKAVYAKGAQLQLGDWNTPIYWPRWGYKTAGIGSPLSLDFDSGHRAKIGYFVNVGQQFQVSRDAAIGLRLFPTTKEGVGLGLDGTYDYTETPASPLFLGRGSFESLYTTKGRGYLDLYHSQDLDDKTRLLLQTELWSDKDFYKDFFYEKYRNRTAPRTFVNVTHTEPTHIAAATVRPNPEGFVRDTERLPEVSWNWLEHRLANNLYVSFDTVAGYNERRHGPEAVRWVNVGRLSYDLNVNRGLHLTPFYEMDLTFYSEEANGDSADMRFANTVGVTAQSRLQRAYPGMLNFSGFKHVVVPSITYSYRPEPTMGVVETPRFDAYDDSFGRSRIETKLDNIILGRDIESEEVWQVARLTLYQGNDFWNEISESEDYEAEFDVRPRAWWGWLMAAEHHDVDDDIHLDDPYFVQRSTLRFADHVLGIRPSDDLIYKYDPRYGSYERLLTYVYYDGAPRDRNYNAHLGYAYTETQDRVYNREILYGLGCKLGEKWGVAFEHRYDFERNELSQQKYEVRRNLHCWEAALLFRERNEGWDVGISFNIVAFPGTKLKF